MGRNIVYCAGLVGEEDRPELHVSRNTVCKILRSDETAFFYERERQPLPRIEAWKAEIELFLIAADYSNGRCASDSKGAVMRSSRRSEVKRNLTI
ncbi:hypothetical protein [Rhizobium laguerreae]|uniref:hypothetical protein n=1 Tax=Rhizobium laguerreae TaxID=1076926 RepID=UPI001C905686|nr:hypothetical protein [Rhizobium laguerreae]MBY3038782.1 hypothetical protein [Rhizobium laguerreae]